jgi:hypothetical protein
VARKLTISLDDPDGVLARAPMIDSLAKGHTGAFYSVGIVTSDNVSRAQSEALRIAAKSKLGRTIQSALKRMQATLRASSPVSAIVHGGGAHFSFRLENSRSIALSSTAVPAPGVVAILGELRALGEAAQSELIRRRAVGPAEIAPPVKKLRATSAASLMRVRGREQKRPKSA